MEENNKLTMKAYIIPIEDYEKAVNRGKEVARFEATTPLEFITELQNERSIQSNSGHDIIKRLGDQVRGNRTKED